MNKNVLIVLAGGFVIAILVAMLVQASLNGSKKKPEAVASSVQILVAARDLTAGGELVAGDLQWQEWPESAVFAGAIVRKDNQKAEEAATGRLSQSVSAGQPIHPGLVVSEGQGNFLAATLKEGQRAVGVSVKAHTMAGGFIGPGDYVDVIITYKVSGVDRDNPAAAAMVSKVASETILENIRVLAVDQEAAREDDTAKVARTVTLEVDADGAERLALASEMGDITLALRRMGDTAPTADNGITTDTKVSKVLKDLARVQGNTAGSGGIVRVYNGNTIQNVPVRQTVEP